MTWIHLLSGAAGAGLAVYLLAAMLRPEWFS